MGTFERFTEPLLFTGDWINDGGGLEQLGDGLNPESGIMSAGLGIGTEFIYLDGDYLNPIGINDLPVGFTILTAQIDSTVTLVAEILAPSVNAVFGASSYLISPTIFNNEIFNGVSVIADINPLPSNVGLFSIGLITVDVNTNPGGEAHALNGVGPIVGTGLAKIVGTYEIQFFQYTFPLDGTSVEANTPNNNTPETSNGTLITITSDPLDPDHLLLDELTISVTCGSVVIKTQTETLLEFWIPSSCSGNGATSITATGNGVQFSGSVSLGSLTVLTTNGSGIYVLTPGATHDTLYSSLRDGTTRNVKIPNPFIKTGFIGG